MYAKHCMYNVYREIRDIFAIMAISFQNNSDTVYVISVLASVLQTIISTNDDFFQYPRQKILLKFYQQFGKDV